MTQAYTTLLYSDNYLAGAVTLATALKDLATARELVALVTDNVSEQAIGHLRASGYDKIIVVKPVKTPVTVSNEFAQLERPDLNQSMTKIRLWQALDGLYDKIVFLDADCLPVQSIDDLFDVELGLNDIAASPDSGWPDIFNSGVFVTRPSRQVFDRLYGIINQTVDQKSPATQRTSVSFDGGDQGLLNQHMKWIRLPFVYNTTPSASYQYRPAYNHFKDDIKVIHFAGTAKPWTNQQQDNIDGYDGLLDQWNNVFNKTTFSKTILADAVEVPINRWDPSKFQPPLDSNAEGGDLEFATYGFDGNDSNAFVYPKFGPETIKLPFEGKSKTQRRFLPDL